MILELPKFTKLETELMSELDIWLYFLRHAETMDTDAPPAAFAQHPLARRALEELKMLAQTDAERDRYEARRQAQLDYNTGIRVARLEGQTEERIRMVGLLEELLHRPATPPEYLGQRSLEDLNQVIEQLAAQLRLGR